MSCKNKSIAFRDKAYYSTLHRDHTYDSRCGQRIIRQVPLPHRNRDGNDGGGRIFRQVPLWNRDGDVDSHTMFSTHAGAWKCPAKIKALRYEYRERTIQHRTVIILTIVDVYYSSGASSTSKS